MTAYSLSFLFFLHSSNLLWNAISGNKALILLCPLILYNPDLNLRLVKGLLSLCTIKNDLQICKKVQQKIIVCDVLSLYILVTFLYNYLSSFHGFVFLLGEKFFPSQCLFFMKDTKGQHHLKPFLRYLRLRIEKELLNSVLCNCEWQKHPQQHKTRDLASIT